MPPKSAIPRTVEAMEPMPMVLVCEQPDRQQRLLTHAPLDVLEGEHADAADDVAEDRVGRGPAPLATLLGNHESSGTSPTGSAAAPPVDPVIEGAYAAASASA